MYLQKNFADEAKERALKNHGFGTVMHCVHLLGAKMDSFWLICYGIIQILLKLIWFGIPYSLLGEKKGKEGRFNLSFIPFYSLLHLIVYFIGNQERKQH